jgi:hypothetical protein
VKVFPDSKPRKSLSTIEIKLNASQMTAILPNAKVEVSVITGEERVLLKVVRKMMPKVILEAM